MEDTWTLANFDLLAEDLEDSDMVIIECDCERCLFLFVKRIQRSAFLDEKFSHFIESFFLLLYISCSIRIVVPPINVSSFVI